LMRLVVQENMLTGTLPTEFGKLVQLQTLSVSMNDLTGSLPSVLSELTNLQGFWFYQNELTGSVADTFCTDNFQWTNLEGDCLPTNGTAEIDCPCCTKCCKVDGEECIDMV